MSFQSLFSVHPKGTIARKITIEAYTGEIDLLFIESAKNCLPPIIDHMSINGITRFIREAVRTLLPRVDFDSDVDVFGQGLDSLKTAELVNDLRNRLKHYKAFD